MGLFDDLQSAFEPSNGGTGLTAPQRGSVAVSNVGSGVDVGGQVIAALSHIQFGLQSQQAAQFQAAQLQQNANAAMATGERQAYNANLQTQLVTSRALAVAAASGGGASDPTVVNTIARISGEGAYRQAVALYQGEDTARRMGLQAEATEYHGAEERANSNLVGAAQFTNAGASLLRGMAKTGSLYQKYGAGGPGAMPGDTPLMGGL